MYLALTRDNAVSWNCLHSTQKEETFVGVDLIKLQNITQALRLVRSQVWVWTKGPVSQKSQKHFWPAKPFLVYLHLKQRGVYAWNFLYEGNLCSYEEYVNKTAV